MRCGICRKKLNVITNTHAGLHGLGLAEYRKRFPRQKIGFPLSVVDLPKSDPRYKKWRASLKKRPPPWSKGYTKETHPSVAKISATFRRKKIDNFAQWRKWARARGLLTRTHPPLSKSQELAFLVGLVLGDGHIQKFPRTEALTITLGTDKPALWEYSVTILQKVFGKYPYIKKRKDSACIILRIYQKHLSKRLGIPTGSRSKSAIRIPGWISGKKQFTLAYLRGLFEAEGSLSIHLPTSTYNFQFSNKNPYLLTTVKKALLFLGFHPEVRSYAIRLRRKQEVFEFQKLINFRKYDRLV